MADSGSDDEPQHPDSPEYWEHNEYQALKVMLTLDYYEAARSDPETWQRYQADRARYAALHEKFAPRPPAGSAP